VLEEDFITCEDLISGRRVRLSLCTLYKGEHLNGNKYERFAVRCTCRSAAFLLYVYTYRNFNTCGYQIMFRGTSIMPG
jgi:hypothetical protein